MKKHNDASSRPSEALVRLLGRVLAQRLVTEADQSWGLSLSSLTYDSELPSLFPRELRPAAWRMVEALEPDETMA